MLLSTTVLEGLKSIKMNVKTLLYDCYHFVGTAEEYEKMVEENLESLVSQIDNLINMISESSSDSE